MYVEGNEKMLLSCDAHLWCDGGALVSAALVHGVYADSVYL